MASYDQLLRQVEVLKMENSTLRQELQDNSTHLSKLESEASNMKEVLKQLQGSIDEDTADSGHELMERLKEMSLDPSGMKPRARPLVPPSSSSSSASSSGAPGRAEREGHERAAPGRAEREGHERAAPGREGHERAAPGKALDDLEKERALLLAELEKEEKEKDWYYAQLQNLTKRIDSLPLTENFTLQTDMSRRQLEFEARQIRSAMEEQLGTCQEMERRAQARVCRIQQIEKEILKLGSKNQDVAHTTSEPGALTPAASSGRLDLDSANDSAAFSVPRRITSHLGTKVRSLPGNRTKVEMVYSLLSMLGTHDKDDMSRTLLAMSSSQDSCIAMRQSGCLPLLIQLLHGNDKDSLLLGNSRGSKEARARAAAALHNIVHSQPEDKRGRRETRVLHLLEQVRVYCESCWVWQEDRNHPMPSPVEHQICPAVCVLMKLSFDEEHRHAMNQLGGLQAIAELLQVDCEMFGLSSDHYSVTLRRYSGMALTNLTFGDVANKATLCSMKGCMRAMVAQLKSESEDLQQVIASVLRNLSWRADVNSKKSLREVGSVRALMSCALQVQKESTLKSVLSALWNLSAHCTENKGDICCVEGALAFLVGTLTHRSHSNTLAIIESGGGILRNVSSLIATNHTHRLVLREHGCLPTLLQHLKSHSLTIVSNACGTLWNLSARDATDQETLWELGAVGMLRNLIHSRHKMIAMGSAAALRNLMANRPARYKDTSVVSPGGGAPSLHARKQKALFEELDAQQLSETFDNIDNLSPKTAHRRGRCAAPGSRSYANTPVLSSPKRHDARVFPPSVRASSDSLNSVTSADGYGNRGKTKPSSTTDCCPEDGAACVYRKYPADLAHKIRSANHMDDDGAELDTPINYSLKYSDEQLNSGRQSPSLSEPRAPRYSNSTYEPPPEQPIDYSLKYSAPKDAAPAPKLRPLQPPAANRVAQKESPQTYCVEDTPICFSRGSSLSSLSSEDEAHEMLAAKRRGVAGGDRDNSNYPTLPASEKSEEQKQRKEAESQTADSASNAKSKRHHHHETRHHHHSASGARTPKSPPEPAPLYAQETPLMFSRCTSVSSLDSFSTSSIASSVRSSEPCSGVPSGVISPSDLPDSPGQTMPPSRAKTPPPPPKQEVMSLRPEAEPSADLLLHFHTESTPHGFSKASSLSALSVDEPYIADLKLAEPYDEQVRAEQQLQPEHLDKAELLEGESDDDIEILEACINMAMPKSSRKHKKQAPQAPPTDSAQPIRKSSQLPVYKLLPPQSRVQSQLRKQDESDDMPRVYCVEGTPLNFSTATSLSDLTIESPPPEKAPAPVEAPLSQRRAPPPPARAPPPEGENGDDILAECINAAMPKSKLRKPQPVSRPIAEQSLQTPPSLPPQVPPPLNVQQQKKKPTSPVKPQQRALRQKPGFTFDSPRHYTPIEGTPCCFSRNDSLSSLDFDEDDAKAPPPVVALPPPVVAQLPAVAPPPATAPPAAPKPADEQLQFSMEDTPVCFSRNSSLSSLSDIDHENNNKPEAPPPDPAPSEPRPPHCYIPKAFHVEDTPVCFSRNSSLSSLSIDSEDDLLQECISSAMPKKKKKAPPPAEAPPPIEAPPPRSPVSPDSESFDWKAIQEGANAIVSSLHAAASLSRQGSSDSDSVLSLKSVGSSPFRLRKAPEVTESPAHNESPEHNESDAHTNPPSDPPSPPERRGARILKPGERSALEPRPEEDKGVRGGKKVYRSLITGKPRSEPSARGRAKPRAVIGPKLGSNADEKTGSSSRDSTPSRKLKPPSPAPKPLSAASPAPKPLSAASPAPKPLSAPSPTPKPLSSASPAPKPSLKPKAAALPRSDSVQKKSDAEKPPALVRQSTFIKETPSPTLKRKLDESQSSAPIDPPSPDMSTQSRAHSESPSRPQEVTSSRINRTGTWKRENSSAANANGKHSTSLPRVGTWKRTGSSSSILSASSESSERGASERGGASEREEEVTSQRRGTWRKKKSSSGERSGGCEDVWVRLEDCPVNNPRSASSCSNAPPIIDSPTSRLPSGSASCSNLNLRRSCESLDDKPQRVAPRGTVAARVSPFNYTPSRKTEPTTTSTTVASTTVASTTPTRPSLIPTPVTKKREPKGEGGAGGGAGGGERGSYIVTSV
ncbi:unnamed protein product [Knipowitschia caucasica]